MKIQRKFFFDIARAKLFDGALNQSQVEGMTAILNYAEKANVDDRHMAYILATTFHETAREMQPIEEYGKGKGKPYGVADPETGQIYFGRGFVQITWRENYERQDKKLKLGGKLVKNAALALDMDIALKILFGGMQDGDFTGKCLGDYIVCENHETDTTDFYNSRKIVNGLDQASTIADYASRFIAGIAHAKRGG